MKQKDGFPIVFAASRAAWRDWLLRHHATESSIWLVIYKKDSGVDSVYYPEAVDESLCFGWIDSRPNKRDTESYYQFFSKRNPKSNWSRVNKEKVKRLIAEGRMHESGWAVVEHAKSIGTWDALNDVEQLIIPNDLQAAFSQQPKALEHWNNFPPSSRRGILEWIFNAKRASTRAKRIRETVEKAAQNIRANQYRK
jgi:uncharacterized protein YdeI (YjbR/CyaY-like superfamily)